MFELDVRCAESSHAMTGGKEFAVVPTLQRGSTQTRQAVAEDSKVSHEEMTHIMQDQIECMDISLKYFKYGDRGEKRAVVIVNTNTIEVIREVSMKELQTVYDKMNEVVRMILSKKI